MQPQASTPRWPSVAIVITVVLALIVALLGAVLILRSGQVGELRDQVAELENDLDEAQNRISDLEAQLAAAPPAAEGGNLFDDLLGGLLGGEGGSSPFEDLLGGLLGGEGDGFGGLFGGLGGNTDLGACLTGAPAQYSISEESLESQMEDIEEAVTDIRDLDFPSDIQPTFVTNEEMGNRVRELTEEALVDEVIDFDTRLWVALAMLEPGMDLAEIQLDLLDSQVAGYYDPETGELVVATVTSNEPLSPTDQITYAHELIHALTDARLGFPEVIDDPRADPERARAVQALIEGDATLGMQQFSLGAIDLMDQFGMIFDPRLAQSREELTDVPFILSNSLQLPYLEGLGFVCSLYGEGGWEAVDAAYDKPPSTTLEILHPELYQSGFTASTPAPAGSPGTGWTELRSVGFGAVDLLNLFSAPADDTGAALSDARERVRAWAGGTATVWSRGEETAVLLNLVESGDAETSLCDSMHSWLEAAQSVTGDDGASLNGEAVVVDCVSESVRVAIAPDRETVTNIVG